MAGNQTIAEAARGCIGTPFRAQGRVPGVGLDCIGLAWFAVSADGLRINVPANYDLSGDAGLGLVDALDALGFQRVPMPLIVAGDILLFQPGRRQQHLGIRTGDGFVHAHLGLRRVVQSPLPAPWPMLGAWRTPRKD